MNPLYRVKQAILVLGDMVALSGAFYLALILRHSALPSESLLTMHANLFAASLGIWIMINYINGFYDVHMRQTRSFHKRIISTALMSLIAGVVFFYIVPSRSITPKTILLLTVVLGYTLIYFWRLLAGHLIGLTQLQTNIAFVGYTPEMKELHELLKSQPALGYHVSAIVDPDNNAPKGMEDVSVYRTLRSIRPVISTSKINLVVVATHLHGDEDTMRELYELLFWPVQLVHLAAFYEQITGRIPPSTFSESWFLDHLGNTGHPLYQKWRSLLDYIAIAVLGFVFIVVFPFVAAAIKINSRGPIFYSQSRVGQGGRRFMLYKFRSMFALTPDGSAEVGGYEFTKRNDKRITLVGNFLRKMRLDELPQVLNLIRRDITFIGPRPERPQLVDELTEEMPYYRLRHVIKPGLTGWAVLHQHYADSKEASLLKLQYDLYYIKNRSFFLDVSIVLRTFNVVIRLLGQ